ncbi:LPS export ABC transporter periplasmic protein LptC [Paracoccus pacificus]|uniref:LPS export ABC transporter periplasmic protein LptC n=1 Tax=Paracoccus pacificus TaxID=1463598 RepID=A0ABW4R659_9RHOB
MPPGGLRSPSTPLRSRIVALLRWLLPLAALVILSTLFMLSRKPDPDAAIPYATVDVEERARAPQITAPRYAGVTPDGAKLTLEAAKAIPDQGDGSAVETLRLEWRAADGLAADISAGQGTMSAGQIDLSGAVRMTLSSGYVLTAPQLQAQKDAAVITSDGPVAMQAPYGTVHAGGMRLARVPGAADGSGASTHVLDLNGGVRLIYQP